MPGDLGLHSYVNNGDVLINALPDIKAHTGAAMRLSWRIDDAAARSGRLRSPSTRTRDESPTRRVSDHGVGLGGAPPATAPTRAA